MGKETGSTKEDKKKRQTDRDRDGQGKVDRGIKKVDGKTNR